MNIGQITQSDEQKNAPRRSGLTPEYTGGRAKLESDIMRLALLLLMLAAGIFGAFYHSHINKPGYVIRHSLKKSHGRAFKSSLEGNMYLAGNRLAHYRARYEFHPKHGLRTAQNESTDEIPYDSVEALKLLEEVRDPVEYEKEDMFGHGTRHFTGSCIEYAGDDSTAFAFEFWTDMRSQLPVRLDIARVDRNAAVNESGEAVSRETYLTIRYHNWDK